MSSPALQPIVVLLGDPVGGNPTQYMVEKAFAYHDLDWRYLTIEVRPEGLADAVRGMRAMGFRGGHCADPHKQAVAALLDRVSQSADLVGAVNFLCRDGDALVGDNIEGKGLVEAMRRMTDPAGKRVVLLGAGRMARAAAAELARAGAAQLTVVNRDAGRAGALAAMLQEKLSMAAKAVAWKDQYEVPPETDVVINATSINHDNPHAALPLQVESLSPEMLVADVTLNQPDAWLLAEAERRECPTLDGLSMYIEQVAIGLRQWTGVEPNVEVMREAVEEFLEL